MQAVLERGIRASVVRVAPVAPGRPSWRGPVLAAVALHALVLLAYVQAFGGNVGALVCLRPAWVQKGPFEAVTVGVGVDGYDGQYYYALARAPLGWHAEYVDLPAYRQARLLYPALAWALSGGGHPQVLLWVLPALNLLAVGGLAWLGALVALRYERNSWWGLVLPVAVNAGMSALRDLTDPLAVLAVCGLLAAWLLRWRPWALGVWAVAAVLSREQNVAVVGLVLLAAVWHRHWGRAAVLAAAAVVWAGWVVALHQAYGAWPVSAGNVGMPLAGLLGRWAQLPTLGRASMVVNALGLTLVTAQVGLCVGMAWTRVNRVVVLVGLAGALLALVGGEVIYADYNSYLRVFAWLPLALWFGCVQTGRTWPVVVLLPMGLWPLLAVAKVWWA